MKMMSVDVAGTKVHQDVLLKDDLQFLGCSVTDFSSESHAAVTNHGPNGDGLGLIKLKYLLAGLSKDCEHPYDRTHNVL